MSPKDQGRTLPPGQGQNLYDFSSTRSLPATGSTSGLSAAVQSMQEYKETLSKPGVVMIDCFATWCGPCKAIAPKVVALSNSHPSARFYKIDDDELPEVGQELGVRDNNVKSDRLRTKKWKLWFTTSLML